MKRLLFVLLSLCLFASPSFGARAGELRAHHITATKPYSGSDSRLVPAASASITIYRQGATAAETKTVLTTATTLAVNDIGSLRLNEVVQLGTSSTTTMLVTALTSRTSITVRSTTGGNISVTDGDRLVLQADKPTLYTDPLGGETTANPLSLNASGNARFYTTEGVVDYTVSGTGITTTLFVDLLGGAIDGVWNVLEYGVAGDGTTDDHDALNRLIDTAIRLAPADGYSTLFFPRGVYGLADTLAGAGENVSGAVTNLAFVGEMGATLKILSGTWAGGRTMLGFGRAGTSKSNILVENLTFDGSSVGATGSTAIVGIRVTDVSQLRIRGCTFKNIGDPTGGVDNPNDGIYLGEDYADAARRVVDFEISGCRFDTIERNGISGINVQHGRITNCYFTGFENVAIDIESNETDEFMHDLVLSDLQIFNARNIALVLGPGTDVDGQVIDAQWEHCYISGVNILCPVGADGINIKNMLDVVVDGCIVQGADTYGIIVESSKHVTVTNCTVSDVTSVGTADASGILFTNNFTVQPVGNICTNNNVHDIDGNAISFIDQDGGVISGNIVSNFDMDAGNRRGIRTAVLGATCRRIAITGNYTKAHATLAGYSAEGVSIGTSVTDCVVVGNIATGTVNTGFEMEDQGTRTIFVGNKDDELSGDVDASRHWMMIPYAAANATGDSWARAVSLQAGGTPNTFRTSSVTNDNIRSASRVLLMPVNRQASAIMDSLFVPSTYFVAGSGFTIIHAVIAPESTATYFYTIIDSDS